jgi:Arc/MetJ-type ribon-helix-helix transcriptional regulator
MYAITVKLPNELSKEIELRAKQLHVSRSEYIRKALITMNHEILLQEKKKRLIELSALVRNESMIINAEFEAIENDIKS